MSVKQYYLCIRLRVTELIILSIVQCDDAGSFKTIAAFECRGVELVDFDPRVNS